jgi:hypothetical protein
MRNVAACWTGGVLISYPRRQRLWNWRPGSIEAGTGVARLLSSQLGRAFLIRPGRFLWGLLYLPGDLSCIVVVAISISIHGEVDVLTC